MGNCIPTQLPCEQLLICCCQRVDAEAVVVIKLRRNLKELEAAIGESKAKKSDMMRELSKQEGPIKKRLETVQDWLSRVDSTVTEVDKLINEAEKETLKLCCAGYCSKNFSSSLEIGKGVVDWLSFVVALNQKQFEQFVETVPADPKYLHKVESDFEELQATIGSLEMLLNTVKQMVDTEKMQHKKPLQPVQDWLSSVQAAMVEVEELITNGLQEIQKLRSGSASDLSFGDNVAKELSRMGALKDSGDQIKVVAEVDTDYIHKLKYDLDALQKSRDQLRGLHDEVLEKVTIEERQHKKRLQTVGGWLDSVKATMAEVDVLSRDGPQEIQTLSLGSCSSYGLAEKVAKSMQEVAGLIERGSKFTDVAQRGLPEAGIVKDSEQTVGLENTFKKVWSCLEEDQTGTVGLYGMGGVGKTSLLTQINNSFIKTRSDFHFVIWIVVSQELKLAKVQEEIGRKIGIFVDEQWKNKSFPERREDVFNVLREKKFVLLLDDVWETVNLEIIGIPLPSPQNGSKIIFTTRLELVCSQMGVVDEGRIKVEPLGWKDAWKLFCKNVGEIPFKAEPAIVPVAKDVAKECDGLPLALITIARAMACKRSLEEWKDALEDLKASSLQGMENEVHPCLKFSYDCLPDKRVKSCFLYCALYPEDYKILKEELINYWICEKFWEDSDSDGVHKKGREIVRTLISASLLEEEGKYVKMHDVLRDMALWIARKFERETENCFVKAGSQLIKAPETFKWRGIRRMSLMENSIEELGEIKRGKEEMVPKCPDLWTLIVRRNPRLRKISEGFFRHMDALLVLDLSSTGIQKLPQGISSLGSLQYLNVSQTEIDRLPSDLELTNLKYLNLEHNRFLEMFPRILISKFKCLQVLKMIHCGFFYEVSQDNLLSDCNVLVEELQQLEDLKVLSITIRCASSLEMLSSTLSNCVQNLCLESFSGSEVINVSLITSMENLETLQISATAGSIYHSPFSTARQFASLREVSVEYCSRLQDLRWLVLAPNLVVLRVAVCEKIEAIISGKESHGENLFARLEELVLEELPQMKSISQNALPFPYLKRIKVIDCPMLTKLPLNSSTAGGLKIIVEGEEHWWKKVEWMDDAPKTDFRILPLRKKMHEPFYLSIPMK